MDNTGRSLRHRAVDATRRLQVVIRPVPNPPSHRATARASSSSSTINQTTGAGAGAGAVADPGIPTPTVVTCAHYLAGTPAERVPQPGHYVHGFVWSGAEVVPASVRYDLLLPDMEWCDEQGDLGYDELELLVEVLEKAAGRRTRSFDCEWNLPREEAVGLMANNMALEARVLGKVYDYWLGRRRSLGKALMRVFQEAPAFDDPSPHVAFRPRERERRVSTRNPRKNDILSLEKMKAVRNDLASTLEMVAKVRKREELAWEDVLLDTEVFDHQLEDSGWSSSRGSEVSVAKTSLPKAKFAEDILQQRALRKKQREKSKKDRLKVPPKMEGTLCAQRKRKVRDHPRYLVPAEMIPFELSSDEDEDESQDETPEDLDFYKRLEIFLESKGEISFENMLPPEPKLPDPVPDHLGFLLYRYSRCNRLVFQPMWMDKSPYQPRPTPSPHLSSFKEPMDTSS